MGKGDIEHAPAWGYCASQNMHYYGYKLHALCGVRGVIHSYDMTAANVRVELSRARKRVREIYQARRKEINS